MEKIDDQDSNSVTTADDAMPVPKETDLKLTAAEANKITAFINNKAIVPKDGCPVCGSPKNFVNEHIWKMETQKLEPTFGGTFQPLVATTCHNCGYVRFFNKIIMEWIMQQAGAVEGEAENGD
jgi:predicted nucleic-acid-binding Zn-ribbon protein